ncbi:FAD-binding oxidoreductase [Actinoplanes sp. TBRC 11911]|uniref:FAD-binding oxidoreductase n=1 Tax=Actinoplanes sp. TBRC 11911 TaxID=2729386 RepID=UPI00145C6E08|nr:FAD-binding oxidoreductase [Actinoplanes sp. TBRC 11911]NMO57766.1 FAD-binding oxidoreductase [Actinoplanes sp. TBRC 11911]
MTHPNSPAELRAGFLGNVVLPADAGYDDARAIYNGMIDRRPSVIAQCENVEDVIRAIRYGRETGTEIAVRGGGHGVAGKALTDGGIVIDLRRMHAVTVDPEARTARVDGGALMSHLDEATQPYGLATTGGRVSSTGVAGFALGGGSGWFERKFGLASDNLLSVDLVTADGELVRASADSHPDLFWALHGGGGNFGVATSLTFRLHSLPTVTAILLLWRPEAGPEVVRAYREFMKSAPDEVGGAFSYATAPDAPFVPDDLVGELACSVLITYAGSESEARDVSAAMLKLGHEGALIGELPYTELQSRGDRPPGSRNYYSAEYLGGFPDEAADRFGARARDMLVPSRSSQALFALGGAVTNGVSDHPIPWRRAEWAVHPYGMWDVPEDDARVMKWGRDLIADVRPWSVGAVYLNFIGDEGNDRIVAGLGEENYRRLVATKDRYDPDNVFHLNQNIKP